MRLVVVTSIVTFFAVGLAAVPASAAELVTNGDFENGNTAFTSTYVYGQTTAPGGYYLNTGGDHTTGSGTYLLADPDGGSDYFWSETFAVQANSDYAFSVYVGSNSSNNEPIFQAQANGAIIAGLPGVEPAGYTHVTGAYNSGSATSVTLRLYNLNSDYSFNDLRVDDISFTGPAAADGAIGDVPEPASWAMMVGGFGMVGGAVRRRRGAGRAAIA